MFKIPFFGKSKRYLGIDIGISSVKVIELSHTNKGTVLENYGERVSKVNERDLKNSIKRKAFFSSDSEIANSVKEILAESKIATRDAVFSIPDFMSFFTVFTTPPMPKEEVASVVRFEAKQHIPLPLQEMTLDWSLIDESDEKDSKKNGLKILLVAVPNKTILKYQKVAEMAGIKDSKIEAEVFSLTRATVKNDDISKIVQLIDIGIQSTTITIAKGGLVRSTYSIDFSIGEIIKQLAGSLDLSYNEAEDLIKSKGLKDEKLGSFLRSQVDRLVSESKQVSDSYFKHEKKEVEKIIIAGGAALMSGLTEYFFERTKKETQVADPFSNISYPPLLKDIIKEMGPRYSVAVGLALRDIDNKK